MSCSSAQVTQALKLEHLAGTFHSVTPAQQFLLHNYKQHSMLSANMFVVGFGSPSVFLQYLNYQ